MFKQQTLQSLIEGRISMRPSNNGWHVFKCPLCNDYKERAGLLFENNEIIFNCFNCSKNAKYEEFSGRCSANFRSILNAFGVDDSEISVVVNSAFFNKSQEVEVSLASLNKVNTHTPPVDLPKNSYKLGVDHSFDIQLKIVEYMDKRRVDLSKYEFFFSTEPQYKERVIIPFYRNGKLIYWQARHIGANAVKDRYLNAPVSKEAVIYNFDELYSYSKLPLFVTEGIFDAMMFDNVSIIGSKLSKAKLEILSKCRRRLVFVIDKDANGAKLGNEVIELGWDITFAPNGSVDINDSVQRFGKIWTAKELICNIPKDINSAKLAIGLNCRK